MLINWFARKGESIPHTTGEHVYFFKKVYEEYVNMGSDDFPMHISHTHDFSELIKLRKNAPVSESRGRLWDLVNSQSISALLHELSQDALKWMEGQSFVDLCVLLGQTGLAGHFAREQNMQYDILECVKNTTGSLRPILSNEAVRIVMDSAEVNHDAARLTRIIYSAVEADPFQLQLALAELWCEGYHWDALCLGTLLQPDKPNTIRMKSRLEKIAQPVKSGKVHKVVELLELMKENGFVGYKDNLLGEVDPVQLYRILKMDILKNEKTKLSDLQKLSVRGHNSEALRRVILAAFIRSSSVDAHIIACDAIHFIKNLGEAFGDYFKGTEKVLFEPAVGIIESMLDTLNLVLNNKPSKMFVDTTDNSVIDITRNSWKKCIADILSETGKLSRDAFLHSAALFLEEIKAVEGHIGECDAEKVSMIELAIKLACELVTVDTVDSKQKIESVSRACGFSKEKAEKIVLGMFQKLDATLDEPVISDRGINFQDELQSTDIETSWLPNEANDTAQLTSAGDEMEPEKAPELNPQDLIARARALLSRTSTEMPGKKNEEDDAFHHERRQSDDAEKTEHSSVSSVTGSASNYVHHVSDVHVEAISNIGGAASIAKSAEKDVSIANVVQEPKSVSTGPTIQFVCGGFEDYDVETDFGKESEAPAHFSRTGPREGGFGGTRGGGPRNYSHNDGFRGGHRGRGNF